MIFYTSAILSNFALIDPLPPKVSPLSSNKAVKHDMLKNKVRVPPKMGEIWQGSAIWDQFKNMIGGKEDD